MINSWLLDCVFSIIALDFDDFAFDVSLYFHQAIVIDDKDNRKGNIVINNQ